MFHASLPIMASPAATSPQQTLTHSIIPTHRQQLNYCSSSHHQGQSADPLNLAAAWSARPTSSSASSSSSTSSSNLPARRLSIAHQLASISLSSTLFDNNNASNKPVVDYHRIAAAAAAAARQDQIAQTMPMVSQWNGTEPTELSSLFECNQQQQQQQVQQQQQQQQKQQQQQSFQCLGASPGIIHQDYTAPSALVHDHPMYHLPLHLHQQQHRQHTNHDSAHNSQQVSTLINNNNNSHINNQRFNSIGHSSIGNNINSINAPTTTTNIAANTTNNNNNNNNNSTNNNNNNNDINIKNNNKNSNNMSMNVNNIFNGANRTSSFNQPSSQGQQHKYCYSRQQNVQLVAPGSIFARRTDYKAFNALPKHKINSYHIKMEDDGSHGNDEVRWYILSNLSANKMSKACCIFCQKLMTIYDKYPLLDGAFFQSPIQHHKLSAKVKTSAAPSANNNNNNNNSNNNNNNNNNNLNNNNNNAANSMASSSVASTTANNVSFSVDNIRPNTTSSNSSSCLQQANENCQDTHQPVTPTNSSSSEEAHYRSTGSFSSSHSSGIGSSLGGSCSSGNGSNFLTSRSDSASSTGSSGAPNGRKSSASSSSFTSSGFVSAAASPPMSASSPSSSVCINPMPSSYGPITSTTSSTSSVRQNSVGRRIGPHAQAFAEKVKQQQQQQQQHSQRSKSPSQDKYINAVCMSCLEGWTYDIRCKFCYQPWIGSHFILGTMYNFDIFAAQPCCQARLSCNACSKLVKMTTKPMASRTSVSSSTSQTSRASSSSSPLSSSAATSSSSPPTTTAAAAASNGESNKNVNSNNHTNHNQHDSTPASNNGRGGTQVDNNGLVVAREYFSHYSQRYRCENCDCKDNHFVKPISALYILKEKEPKLSQLIEKSNRHQQVAIRPEQQHQ